MTDNADVTGTVKEDGFTGPETKTNREYAILSGVIDDAMKLGLDREGVREFDGDIKALLYDAFGRAVEQWDRKFKGDVILVFIDDAALAGWPDDGEIYVNEFRCEYTQERRDV